MNPIESIQELIKTIEGEPNYLEYNAKIELIEYLGDDWSFWKFTRELSKNKLVPNEDFKVTDDIVECVENIKSTENPNKFCYALLFIGLKNRILKERIEHYLNG